LTAQAAMSIQDYFLYFFVYCAVQFRKNSENVVFTL